MKTSILNADEYYKTVYGGWLGKNIGGTLGCHNEGDKQLLDLTFYPELPDGPLANDDLDLQLVWLHALEQYGPKLTAKQLGQEWIDHIFFPFDEYGYALTNLRRGLIPPVAGWFNNPFNHCMGSPIRSEIWAMVAPGAPEVAAHLAYQDAIVDHAGGEGVYGEVFFVTIESAIFIEKDRDRLIEIGLRSIPGECRTAKAVKDLLQWHQQGKSWLEARLLILKHHGHDNFTDAPQNVAFTILGWLYGEDFEDAILKAVNCGYDTDCTAATLGAILGMILGPDGLPEKWAKPIGDKIVVSPPIKGFPAPSNLDELTKRTIRMGKHVLAAWDTNIIIHDELLTQWNNNISLNEITPVSFDPPTFNRHLLPEGSQSNPQLSLIIDYGQEGPAIGNNGNKTMKIIVENHSKVKMAGNLSIQLPEGWTGTQETTIQLESDETLEWDIEVISSNQVQPYYDLAICWEREHDGSSWSTQRVPFTLVHAAAWTVWGPGSLEGTKILCPGNRIVWESAFSMKDKGIYRAVTRMNNPRERVVRIITAANTPVTVKLNGEKVIECQDILEFMPAYHRAPQEQLIELVLAEGIHELELEVVMSGDLPEVYVLPVSTKETTSPGPRYYHTDILFGN